MLYWILVGTFPAKKTFECLKKPVKGETRHWCIFWSLFAALRCFDPILSFLPFFSVFSTVLLIGNYNQHLSELTLKGGLGLLRYSQLKIKNHDVTTKIMVSSQKFYKNNHKILNKVKVVLDGVISMFSSLNEGISNMSSQTLLQNLQHNTQTSLSMKSLDNIMNDEVSDEQHQPPVLSNRRIKSSPDLTLSNPVITLKGSSSNLNNVTSASMGSTGTTLGNLASYITSALPISISGNKEKKEEDSFFMSFDD
jgi:hypothetical protein